MGDLQRRSRISPPSDSTGKRCQKRKSAALGSWEGGENNDGMGPTKDHWLGREFRDAGRNRLKYTVMEGTGCLKFPFSLPDWYFDGPRDRVKAVTLTILVFSRGAPHHFLSVRWDVSGKHSSSVRFP